MKDLALGVSLVLLAAGPAAADVQGSGAEAPAGPEPAARTRIELRVEPLAELYFSLRGHAAQRDEPAEPGLEAAVAATRRIQEQLGSWGGWGPLDARVLAAGGAGELAASFAELDDPMERRGREISVRDDALALAAALAAFEPGYDEMVWPQREEVLKEAVVDLAASFLPRHPEALAFMLSSLGIPDPAIGVPIYLVTRIHPPGASTYYLSDGAPVAVVGLEAAGDGTHRLETLLHEATHALDLASRDTTSAFDTLRRLLEGRGFSRRDALFHDVPHTLMFVQAAETTRRFYDPDHVDYGDVSGAYGRSSDVAGLIKPIWSRRLAGEIDLDAALREIVATVPGPAAGGG